MIRRVDLRSDQRIRFLTLTITSSEDLPGMIKQLIASFRRLRQRAYWKARVDGGAYVLEVTGNPGKWHAHLHVVLQSTWLKWRKLLDIWRSVSPGRGVYIQVIPRKAVVNYLTKYLSKPNVTENLIPEVGETLAGFRLFQPFGKWQGLAREWTPPPTVCRICGGNGFQLAYFAGVSNQIQYWKAVDYDADLISQP